MNIFHFPQSAALLILAAFFVSPIVYAGDAVIVNSDGTTKFNYTVSGPNVLGTKTPVAIAGGTTLDADAAGKIYTISGTAADYTITLPPAGIGAGVIVGFSVAPYASANKQYTIATASGQTLDGRSSLALIHTNYLEVISIGGQWVSRVKKVDTDWVDAGAPTIFGTVSNPTKGPTTLDKLVWRRIASNLEFTYRYYQSSNSSSNGSGTYYIQFPNGFLADTSGLLLWDGVTGHNRANSRSTIGRARMDDVYTIGEGDAILRTSNSITFLSTNGPGTAEYGWANNAFTFSNGFLGVTTAVSVPIVGW
jgi:hypothetical protein